MDRHMLALPTDLTDPQWEAVFENCEDLLATIVDALRDQPEQQNDAGWVAYLAFLAVLERTGMDAADVATALGHAAASAAVNVSLRGGLNNPPGCPRAAVAAMNIISMSGATMMTMKLRDMRPAEATVQ